MYAVFTVVFYQIINFLVLGAVQGESAIRALRAVRVSDHCAKQHDTARSDS